MFSLIKRASSAAVIVYLMLAAGIFLFQRQFLYFPTHENLSPEDVNLTEVMVEKLQTQDGEAVFLWYTPARESKPTILFFHGNGGEIGHRAARFQAYQDAGFGVAFLSWRGYGASTGSPSEKGLLIDADAAYQWLIDHGVLSEDIVLIGESLGTGVAVQLAAKRPIAALILGAPYTATVDIAAHRFPWLPVRLLMWDQFRSIEYIDAVKVPVLIVHGTADTIIPYASGVRLHEAIRSNGTFVTLQNQGHQMLFREATWKIEIDFIRGIIPN